jgi:hypothetical protein
MCYALVTGLEGMVGSLCLPGKGTHVAALTVYGTTYESFSIEERPTCTINWVKRTLTIRTHH